MTKVYHKSVVAFVDLLGFKEAIKNEENAQQILDVLNQIKKGESKTSSVSTKVIGDTTIINLRPTVSVFSDSMVISASESLFDNTVTWRHAVIEILNIVQQLANLAIQKGFLLRGGMALGNLYHNDGIVFGPALVEAYELEKEKAKFPRILATKELVDLFNADKNGGTHACFLQDSEGYHFLDYLPVAITHSNQNNTYQDTIQQTTIKLMAAAAKDERVLKVLEKWFWFEQYHRETVDRHAFPA